MREALCFNEAADILSVNGCPSVMIVDRCLNKDNSDRRNLGERLAEIARLSDPECFVIYTHDWPSDGTQHPRNAELYKPFQPSELQTLVDRLVGTRFKEAFSFDLTVADLSDRL
jgi:hypothetical protein